MMEKEYVELNPIPEKGLVVLSDLCDYLGMKQDALRSRLEQHGIKPFRYGRGKYLVSLQDLHNLVSQK